MDDECGYLGSYKKACVFVYAQDEAIQETK